VTRTISVIITENIPRILVKRGREIHNLGEHIGLVTRRHSVGAVRLVKARLLFVMFPVATTRRTRVKRGENG